MITVRELIRDPHCLTRIWISEAAEKEVRELDGRERKRLLANLTRYAKNGLWNYDVPGGPIKHEWEQVYRIKFELFRLIGFYEDEHRTDFIAVDGFKKSGQALSRSQRNCIDKVALVRKARQWKKEQ